MLRFNVPHFLEYKTSKRRRSRKKKKNKTSFVYRYNTDVNIWSLVVFRFCPVNDAVTDETQLLRTISRTGCFFLSIKNKKNDICNPCKRDAGQEDS